MRSPNNEKDIDNVQQHQEETNPWFSRPDGHQRRPLGPQQEAGEGQEETDGVTPLRPCQGLGRQSPRKGAVRHGNPHLWQRRACPEETGLNKDLRPGEEDIFETFHHNHMPEPIGAQKAGHDGQ